MSKQKYWQILPLNPCGTFTGSSPYASYSAFAGNPLFISPDFLVRDGFLTKKDLEPLPSFSPGEVDYSRVIQYKSRILQQAYRNFRETKEYEKLFETFCQENEIWLDDYAMFVALKQHFEETSWVEWPPEVRDKEASEMQRWAEKLQNRIDRAKFYQFLFFRQWFQIKEFCAQKGIEIIGDVPIYVSNDSADVWANPHLFKLDENKLPRFVSGAPPDYFSKTGQRWGSPVYDWDICRKENFSWWLRRIGHNLKLYDKVRLDHFRGFIAYWEVPAEEETALHGKWVEAPGRELFTKVLQEFPGASLIAEDLGFITPDVRQIMEEFRFPGMKILLFAFGPDMPTNPYIPHNYTSNCVVYTGTHDNNTICGWFYQEASAEERKRLLDYLGKEEAGEGIHWDLIRLAFSSVADTVIIPMQDYLGLGEEARMNRPQQAEGNWKWRLLAGQITTELAKKLRHLAWLYNRD